MYREELEKSLGDAGNIKDIFYMRARATELHPFVEFAGMMSIWIDMVKTSADQMTDEQLPFDWGRISVAKDGQVKYLAEKFDCIFGDLFRDENLRKIFLEEMGWEKQVPSPSIKDTCTVYSEKE